MPESVDAIVRSRLNKSGDGTPLGGIYDSMFGVDDNIEKIPLDKLVPFPKHPFKVEIDDNIKRLAQDIAANGLIHPIVVRKVPIMDIYEILSGHRRTEAVRLLGQTDIAAKVLSINDEKAADIVIKSNFLQRENILPSERAKAYQLRNECLKINKKFCKKSVVNADEIRVFDDFSDGWKNDDTYRIMETEFGESKSSIFMYLRLNFLTDDLLDLTDSRKLQIKIAAELSYLSKESQGIIYEYFYKDCNAKLDLNLAKQIRAHDGEITAEALNRFINKYEKSKKPKGGFTIKASVMKKYNGYFKDSEELSKTILRLLDDFIKTK